MRWLIGCWEMELGQETGFWPLTSSPISNSIVIYFLCWCSQVKFHLRKSPIAFSVWKSIKMSYLLHLRFKIPNKFSKGNCYYSIKWRGCCHVFFAQQSSPKPQGSMRAASLFLFDPVPEKRVWPWPGQLDCLEIQAGVGLLGMVPDCSWALHCSFLEFRTCLKNQKLNNNNPSISAVKPTRNFSWSGFQYLERKRQKQRFREERRETGRACWWHVSPLSYSLPRLLNGWVLCSLTLSGLWCVGYVWGSNTQGKEGRK